MRTIALLSITLMAACADDSERCTVPQSGLYDAHHEPRSGDCPPSTPAGAPHVFIDTEDSLVAQAEMLDSGFVTSYSKLDGCAAHVVQEVMGPSGQPTTAIEIDVVRQQDGTLSGTAEVIGIADGGISCQGSFDVLLTRSAD